MRFDDTTMHTKDKKTSSFSLLVYLCTFFLYLSSFGHAMHTKKNDLRFISPQASTHPA